jgi:H+/gluconate symporter-like permease
MEGIIGLIGIILALALFLVLVYKGWSSYWVAPLCALVVAVFNQLNPVDAVSSYIGGIVDLAGSLFSIVFLGAMLGRAFSDTGAASAIAKTLTNKLVLGKKGNTQVRVALLVILIVAGLCTMGGIDGYVLTFTMFPICVVMAEMVDIPRRFIPAMICLNCAFMAAPGAPQINNIMAQAALGSVGLHASNIAALIPGIVSTLIIACGGYFTLSYMVIKAKSKGEHFEYGEMPRVEEGEERKLPNFFVALLPLIAVFVCYTIIEMNIFFALLIGLVVNLIFMGWNLPKKDNKGLPISFGKSIINTLNIGAGGFPNALLTVITPSGLATVVTTTAAFGMVVGFLSGVNIHYIFLTLLFVCIIVAITSSPPVALMVAIPIVVGVLGAKGMEVDANGIARVGAIAATTFETLPVNGLIILTLGMARTTHKQSYKPMFFMTVMWTLIGAAVAAIMIALFPGLS